ncbi:MAG: hypothetical protein E7255_09865 [Lachnospiraceae bacterium]|jgi:hypothetical protein|nr:hypothetical protein [Lachnospiraceae bacterium]
MKKLERFFFEIAVMSIMSLVLTSAPILAETDPSWGSQTPHINVPTNTYNDTWKTPMNAAAVAWNGTDTKVTVGVLSTSKNSVLAASYTDTWYGTASSANPGPFTIKLNARTISNDATNFANFVQSTLVHEYGHIFCLDHTTKTSIMNSSRDRNTMITPQAFDVSEVNSVYK